MHHPSLAGLGCGVMAGALWGVAILAPALIGPFTPAELAACRFTSYGVLSLLMIAPRWKRIAPHVGMTEGRGLIQLSILGNIFYYVLLGTAIQFCGVAIPALIVGFLPVTVTVVGAFEHGAVPLRRLAPSILLSSAGMGCIAWQAAHMAQSGSGHTFTPWHIGIGLLCAVGALASWSAYAVINARWLRRLAHISNHDWNLLTGLATGVLALLLLPVAFWGIGPIPTEGWMRFLMIASGTALLASVIGNAFWNQMCRLLPLTMVGQMILFETLFSLLYGFVWEQRLPTMAETLAILLVSSGVITCMHAHRPIPTARTRPTPDAL